jgi:hypothetical protein
MPDYRVFTILKTGFISGPSVFVKGVPTKPTPTRRASARVMRGFYFRELALSETKRSRFAADGSVRYLRKRRASLALVAEVAVWAWASQQLCLER